TSCGAGSGAAPASGQRLVLEAAVNHPLPVGPGRPRSKEARNDSPNPRTMPSRATSRTNSLSIPAVDIVIQPGRKSGIRTGTAPKLPRRATIYQTGWCGRQQGMTTRVGRVGQQLRQMLGGEGIAGLRDAELLQRFLKVLAGWREKLQNSVAELNPP